MAQEIFDVVMPLFKVRWNTCVVLEGLTHHYSPRTIHVITPAKEVEILAETAKDRAIAPLEIHAEEDFFQPLGLTKESICGELDLGKSLYTPGWFYQQLLKLGAFEGIAGLSEWYLVWDSDLLPVATWPILTTAAGRLKHTFALLQHNGWGNASIVSKWKTWINEVLGVPAVTDPVATFTAHHMWFKQEHLKSFGQRINQYFDAKDHWLCLMMRSANQFGTFGEYWCYSSWVANQASEDLSFHPYELYGATTERFFDDGTGLFFTALRDYLIEQARPIDDDLFPSYREVDDFIRVAYGADALPSSLSFESSPRHLKKNEKTMHIEESRSRWNPRRVEPSSIT
ncbi:hypothetical protein S7335_5481 [Synechococcus sp. PCC 7335]|uniref:DUF6492 family protein n=1 Tax=Synechococcus sp. (strain ATCC 29403 / PCC 7335) TaxID=91464 RepID=UPI00017EBC84|nr:DUF6492 family protein [Synechococcus sp. PCC 7335]EDX87771.1 hypothetical protein S7335_5481 [Synechococcus sp. PCC 7335]